MSDAVVKDTRPRRSFLQRTTIWIPAGVIALLMAPLALTSRTFGNDWTLHLWLIRQQEMNIQANGRPGLFLSARPLGAFYPVFAFVGSGLYTSGAYLALALGDEPVVAYKLLYFAALCMAYGGMTWLAWQVGLRGWRSQMPGLVFVSGAYFITDMFGRGDLGELVALSAIPLLIAAVTAVAISRQLRVRYLLAVVLGVFVLSGSHNITLLYGTIFLGLLALVVLGAYLPSQLSRIPWRRLPALLIAAAIGGGLNAWYLLPDLKYGFGIAVAKVNQQKTPTTDLSQWRLLLDPLRPSKSPFPDIRLSLPWLFALWAIVVAAIAWRAIDNTGRRVIALLVVVSGAYVYLIRTESPWRSFPHFLYNIQFTLRLHPYVLLATALLVMVVLLWQVRADHDVRRASSAALAAIALFSLSAALWQAWAVPSTYSHGRERTAPSDYADVVVSDRFVRPQSWYERGGFRDLNAKLVAYESSRYLDVPEADVRGSNFSGRLAVPEGSAPFRTDVAAGPHLLHFSGITPIGITANGFVVAVRTPGTPLTGPVDVTIHQTQSNLLRLGALVSLLSLAALALLVALPAIVWLRRHAGAARRLVRPADAPSS